MTVHQMENGRLFANKVRENKRQGRVQKKEKIVSKNVVLRILKKYADVTTGHGITYICEPEGSIFSRTLWAIIVLVCLVLSSVLAYNAYRTWKDDPILTTIKNTGLSIKKIQFPAITLCYQGNIKEVTDSVIELQWKEYLKEVRNTTMEKIKGKKIEYFKDYLRHYFNSSDISLQYVIKMIKASNPEASARSAIALGTMDPCQVNKITIFDESETEEASPTGFPSPGGNTSTSACPYNFHHFGSLSTCTLGSSTPTVKQELDYECNIRGGSPYRIQSAQDIKVLDKIRSDYNLYYKYFESPFLVDMSTKAYDLKQLKDAIKDFKNITFEDGGVEEGYCISFTIGYYQNITFKHDNCLAYKYLFCVKYISECSGDNNGLSNIDAVEQLISPEISRKIDTFQGKIKSAVDIFFKNMNKKESYERLMELLWLDKLPCFDNKFTTVSFIRKCWWKGREIPCVSLFSAVATDTGICCAFNLQKAEEMYRDTLFSATLNKLREKDMNLSRLPAQLPADWKQKKEPFPSDGKQSGLTVMLDANSNLIDSSTVTSDESGFYAYIDGRSQYPILSRKSIPIRPNKHNYVALSAYDVVSDKQLREISPEKRNCYFHDEHTLLFFKNYTRNNCLFECNIKQGRMNISCTPWFFPTMNNESEICDPWSAKKFAQAMKTVNEDECDCKPDCDVTVYTSSVSSLGFRYCTLKNLGLSYFCDFSKSDLPSPNIFGEAVYDRNYQDSSVISEVRSKFSSNLRRETELFSIDSNTYDPSDLEYDAYEKDIAMVNFYFDTSAITQYARQKKLTTIEFISQIGGLLGLFIGFSIISFIELAYWFIYKMFFTLIQKKRE